MDRASNLRWVVEGTRKEKKKEKGRENQYGKSKLTWATLVNTVKKKKRGKTLTGAVQSKAPGGQRTSFGGKKKKKTSNQKDE